MNAYGYAPSNGYRRWSHKVNMFVSTQIDGNWLKSKMLPNQMQLVRQKVMIETRVWGLFNDWFNWTLWTNQFVSTHRRRWCGSFLQNINWNKCMFKWFILRWNERTKNMKIFGAILLLLKTIFSTCLHSLVKMPSFAQLNGRHKIIIHSFILLAPIMLFDMHLWSGMRRNHLFRHLM